MLTECISFLLLSLVILSGEIGLVLVFGNAIGSLWCLRNLIKPGVIIWCLKVCHMWRGYGTATGFYGVMVEFKVAVADWLLSGFSSAGLVDEVVFTYFL